MHPFRILQEFLDEDAIWDKPVGSVFIPPNESFKDIAFLSYLSSQTIIHSWNTTHYLFVSKNKTKNITEICYKSYNQGLRKSFNTKPLNNEIVAAATIYECRRKHKQVFNNIIKEELMMIVWNPAKPRGEWLYLDDTVDM